jgi:hypothetical protein
MSLLKKLAKFAGGAIGGAIGGPAGAAIGSSLAGAVVGSSGAKKAASTAAAGSDAAAQEQRNALMQVQQYQQPYLDAGSPAINALNRVNQGDYSGFNQSPDYLYARDQALQGVQGSAAARGGLYSGNAGRELVRVGEGLASQNLGNYRNALMGQIGIGQSAANNLGNATFNAANGTGNALMASGDARASGIVGSTNAVTGGIQDLAGIAGDYFGNKLAKKKPVAGANALYGYNYRPSTNGSVA